MNIQRKDLAIDMRSKLGDWNKVLKICKEVIFFNILFKIHYKYINYLGNWS